MNAYRISSHEPAHQSSEVPTKTLSPAQLERLRQIDSPRVANAIETFDVRLRNTGFTDRRTHCMFPNFPNIAGYAVTACIHTSTPPMEGTTYYDRTDWWNYILSIPAPRIVVMEDADPHPGLGSIIGDVHASILSALGCVALVTNGAVRDIPALKALHFQTFASSVSVSHAYAHIFEFGLNVTVAGMKVRPGDLLHGDRHGVQTVPIEIADAVPDAADVIRYNDERIISLCRSKDFSIEKLRELIKDTKK